MPLGYEGPQAMKDPQATKALRLRRPSGYEGSDLPRGYCEGEHACSAGSDGSEQREG